MILRQKKNQRGMTLVEILIAASLGLIIVTVGLRFVIQTLKSYQYETGKLLVNRDIRSFTQRMVDDATYANSFLVFDQKSNLTRTSPQNTVAAGGSSNPTATNYKGYTAAKTFVEPEDDTPRFVGAAKLEAGMPGDVVVFVYNKDGNSEKIRQLIIYYRDITTTTDTNGANSTTLADRTKSLRRLVVTINHTDTDATTTAAWKAATVWHLLPDLANVPTTLNANNSVVFPYVDGQANDVVPTGSLNRRNKMFYNLNNTSVLVRGRIYENYTPSGSMRLVKSTYNFTVTPRG